MVRSDLPTRCAKSAIARCDGSVITLRRSAKQSEVLAANVKNCQLMTGLAPDDVRQCVSVSAGRVPAETRKNFKRRKGTNSSSRNMTDISGCEWPAKKHSRLPAPTKLVGNLECEKTLSTCAYAHKARVLPCICKKGDRANRKRTRSGRKA